MILILRYVYTKSRTAKKYLCVVVILLPYTGYMKPFVVCKGMYRNALVTGDVATALKSSVSGRRALFHHPQQLVNIYIERSTMSLELDGFL